MSGKFLARVLTMSLALILAACGGDDSSTPLVAGGNGTGSGGGGTGGGDGEEQTVSLELGTGSGASFQSGQMAVSAPNLTSGGTTRLDFNVVNAADGNSIYNATETTVTLSSECSTAVLDTPFTTSSGKISTTYEAGCAGADTITARLDNGATAIANVTVAAQEFGALEFVSVDPDSIALSGSSDSNRSTVSEVTFRLADKNGSAITGGNLTFSLSTTVGGITLSQTSAETGPDGQASTRVNAGSVATVVSVTATYDLPDGGTIQTGSDPISISSSIPDQDSFSISVEQNFLPNARNYDGVEVPITIRAADRNNNRVDGAVVNFLTNAGSVQNECTLAEGACSIQWISQDPRAVDGVVLILSRTVGEESFRDLNSDGKYTQSADEFVVATADRGEAFLDRNQNGARDSNEEFFDYNSSGTYDGPNGIYNGTACADAPNCTTELLEISQTAKIFMASDDIVINFTTAVAPGQVCAEVAGVFPDGNGGTIAGPPPGGTEVAFSTTNGSVVAPSSFTSTTSYRETPIEFCVIVEADDTPDTGTFTVEVTPPAPYNGDAFVLQSPISD